MSAPRLRFSSERDTTLLVLSRPGVPSLPVVTLHHQDGDWQPLLDCQSMIRAAIQDAMAAYPEDDDR